MTYDELNGFILNYLKNDITGRAIMLSGEWGSGKSHYVKNELKPYLVQTFLNNFTNRSKCAIIYV